MGLFGPSKKEKYLQSEVERLTSLLLPEQRDIENLNNQISNLKLVIEDLENNMKKSSFFTKIAIFLIILMLLGTIFIILNYVLDLKIFW